MTKVFLGLGSNLGDREWYLGKAIEMLLDLEEVSFVAASSVLETEPVDYIDQPDFLNQVIVVETELPPAELLEKCQGIELSLGRKRDVPKGPRTMDIDILLYGDLVLDREDLTIPHGGIKKRDFVLKHLLELEPELCDPESKMKYSEVMKNEFDKKYQ